MALQDRTASNSENIYLARPEGNDRAVRVTGKRMFRIWDKPCEHTAQRREVRGELHEQDEVAGAHGAPVPETLPCPEEPWRLRADQHEELRVTLLEKEN